jgi:hypothetical protein
VGQGQDGGREAVRPQRRRCYWAKWSMKGFSPDPQVPKRTTHAHLALKVAKIYK